MTKDSLRSFSVRVMADGAVILVQTSVPLLALKFGASPVLLGVIGWAAMAVRLPFCLAAGSLSDRYGRKIVAVPAAVLFVLASAGVGFSQSNLALLVFYTLLMVANGTFHPPLQSFIGDISARGQLARNVGASNFGWVGGIALTIFALGWLVDKSLRLPPFIAAVFSIVALVIMVTWRKPQDIKPDVDSNSTPPPAANPRVLLASRIGHFLGFTGFAIIVILFPKLGQYLGWTDKAIAQTVAAMRGGVALGILAANLYPWWRGKFWPQPLAQALMLLFGIIGALSSRQLVLSIAFCGVGATLGIAYTSAMYHGLSGRLKMGKNSGIHESLVSLANITGCLIGGVLAQAFTPRAPFVFFCVLVAFGLVATAAVRYTADRSAARTACKTPLVP